MLKEEKITSWYRRQNQPCWKLCDGDVSRPGTEADKKNIISSYMPDQVDDLEEGEELLVETIEELQPGTYTLETYASPTATKTRRAVSFRHTSGQEAAQAPRQQAQGIDDFIGRLREEREAALQQAKEDFARELEIHDLKRDKIELEKRVAELKSENKELASRASDIEEKKVSYIGQAVAAVSQMFGTGQQQPAAAIGTVEGQAQAVEEEEEEETTNSDQARLTRVIAILRQKEPDEWLNLLEGIARIAQNDPATYNLARGFILK